MLKLLRIINAKREELKKLSKEQLIQRCLIIELEREKATQQMYKW